MLNVFICCVFVCLHSQAAVEIPQYVGVNLLVEGVPIRRSRPLLHRETVIPNSPSDQSCSEEPGTAHKPSVQKPHAITVFRRSGKENRVVGEEKRQLTSVSSKREVEGRTEVQNTSCFRRASRSLAFERPLVVHTEPQSKARRLALRIGAKRATLVPQSLSFSLSPLHNMPECKSQSNPDHASHIARSFHPQAAFEPQHKTSTCVFPSLLPTLEVFSLRPKVVGIACGNTTLPSHLSLPRHKLLVCSHRQSISKCKGDCVGEHKH